MLLIRKASIHFFIKDIYYVDFIYRMPYDIFLFLFLYLDFLIQLCNVSFCNKIAKPKQLYNTLYLIHIHTEYFITYYFYSRTYIEYTINHTHFNPIKMQFKLNNNFIKLEKTKLIKSTYLNCSDGFSIKDLIKLSDQMNKIHLNLNHKIR